MPDSPSSGCASGCPSDLGDGGSPRKELPAMSKSMARRASFGRKGGIRELDEALARGRPGPRQVQAAIAALHATERDWKEIAGLYDELRRMRPSPAVEVARAIARGMAFGPDIGLADLAGLPPEPTVLAARADLLQRAARPGAFDAYAAA